MHICFNYSYCSFPQRVPGSLSLPHSPLCMLGTFRSFYCSSQQLIMFAPWDASLLRWPQKKSFLAKCIRKLWPTAHVLNLWMWAYQTLSGAALAFQIICVGLPQPSLFLIRLDPTCWFFRYLFNIPWNFKNRLEMPGQKTAHMSWGQVPTPGVPQDPRGTWLRHPPSYGYSDPWCLSPLCKMVQFLHKTPMVPLCILNHLEITSNT